MRYQAELAIREADVILFVVDGKTGIQPQDQDIADILRTSGKPVILVVNKIDSVELEMNIYEFYNLGLGDPIGISAVNLMNLGDLLDEVLKYINQIPVDEDDEEAIHIALVGRPNVGKSSLTNALLGQDRVIVSDIPGTTRDSIDTHWKHGDTEFILIDTAGMRRKGKIDLPVERYSVVRALRSVDRSDVAVLVIDAVEGVTEQDKKIAGYVHEAGKGCIIVVNKWDLVEKDSKTSLKYTDDIRRELAFMQYAPAKSGRPLKIYYMTQASVQPPTFVLFVNDPSLVHFSYTRYLENRLRETFGFEGTPIRLVLRGKKGDDRE